MHFAAKWKFRYSPFFLFFLCSSFLFTLFLLLKSEENWRKTDYLRYSKSCQSVFAIFDVRNGRIRFLHNCLIITCLFHFVSHYYPFFLLLIAYSRVARRVRWRKASEYARKGLLKLEEAEIQVCGTFYLYYTDLKMLHFLTVRLLNCKNSVLCEESRFSRIKLLFLVNFRYFLIPFFL